MPDTVVLKMAMEPAKRTRLASGVALTGELTVSVTLLVMVLVAPINRTL